MNSSMDSLRSLDQFIENKTPGCFLTIEDVLNSLEDSVVKINRFENFISFSYLQVDCWQTLTLTIGDRVLDFKALFDIKRPNQIVFEPYLNLSSKFLLTQDDNGESDDKLRGLIEGLVFDNFLIHDTTINCPEILEVPEKLQLVFGKYQFRDYLEYAFNELDGFLYPNPKISYMQEYKRA